MDEEREKLSLSNILGGAAIEAFDRCLNDEVLPNIADINTTMKKREITLKISIVPADENRSLIVFEANVDKKLRGQEPIKGNADIKIEKGKAVAYERISQQQPLPFGKVTPIGKVGGKSGD